MRSIEGRKKVLRFVGGIGREAIGLRSNIEIIRKHGMG